MSGRRRPTLFPRRHVTLTGEQGLTVLSALQAAALDAEKYAAECVDPDTVEYFASRASEYRTVYDLLTLADEVTLSRDYAPQGASRP